MTATHSWTPGTSAGELSPLRERCRVLGMPTWRCDRAGLITVHPVEKGSTGLWLRSPVVEGLVTTAAAAWSKDDAPACVEAFPGAWLIPLEERRRRERTGFTIAMAMSAGALTTEVFLRACGAAQLDSAATRKSMSGLARFDDVAAQRTAELLRFSCEDLERIREHDETVSGFTRQLTDCFETIDLLYALGRMMTDLTQPELFVRRLVDRLHATMCFGWLAVWIAPDERLPGPVSGRLISAGTAAISAEALERAALERFGRCGAEGQKAGGTKAAIVSWQGSNGGGEQALMQPVSRSGRTAGVVAAGNKHGDDPQVSSYDMHLLEAGSGYLGAYLDNAALYAEQQRTFLGTLEALSASIDAKDPYTCGHSERVAHLSWQLARVVGMTEEQAERVRIAGLVHDVGKIGVPEAVLTKQGRLTEPEFAAIKRHPEIGHRILKDIPLLADVLPGVLYHHERWDGAGYPHGLKGEEIPLMARLIALADTFDAMSSTRSYRSAMPRERVLEEIRRCAGGQFDAALVESFCGLDFGTYDEMSRRSASREAPAD